MPTEFYQQQRSNKMEERSVKLDKYIEAATSKKQQRSEVMINGRTGALNMKITTRMKSVNESVEDRPKNICLSKRARTSVAEFQSNGLKKQQHVAVAKDVNFLKDSGRESDHFERMRRLAAVEEGWDKKIKRKRSIGTILSRPINSDDGVPKRAIQNMLVDERGVQQHDAPISRSSNCDDSYTTKKKALRTTQIGWETSMAKERLTSQERDNNHRPSLGQWVGQRPPKVPRTRRSNSNLVSNQDDCSPSNGSPRNATNGSLKLILKPYNLQTEVEESVGGERQTKGRMGNKADGIHVQDIEPSVTLSKKNKAVINEESVWRKGRSARGLLISRCSKSPMGNELDKADCKKNDSKSGSRLKRLSEYKGLSNDAPLQNSSSPDSTGESDDDQEELLSAATHAHVASSCSRPFLKKVESSFTPISSEEKSLLSQRLGLEERKACTPRQQTESFFKKHDTVDKTPKEHTPFYQRVLSALIIEDDNEIIDGLEEVDARNIQIQKSFSDTYRLNESEPRKKARVENSCGQSHGLTKKSFTEDEILGGTSKSQRFHGCQYEEMSLDDKLLLELQCIGLCPDALPGLEENEDEMIPHENEGLAINKQTPNRGKNKKLLLNNISGGSGTRGKRTAGPATKPPRAPKPKPSQKTNLPLTPEGKSVDKPTTITPRHRHPTQPSTSQSANNNKRRDIGSEVNDDNTPVEDLERIGDELGGIVGDPHDLSCLLTFDEEDPQVDLDMDFAAGLAVPDDDLTDLCIF